MTTQASDISVVFSGGSSNIDPNASLGGDPSNTPVVSNVINNLFADVTPAQSAAGREDYRCIYFFNDGDTQIWNCNLWIAGDVTGGATPEIGIASTNEVQRITITGGPVTGGSFTLGYGSNEFVSNFNADLGVWATALQTSILLMINLDGSRTFHDVAVTAQAAGSTTVIFNIAFSVVDGLRSNNPFVVVNNLLTPLHGIDITITTTQDGAPINTISGEINLDTTPPGGVLFELATEATPINIPRLEPNEGFPLWIKRTVIAGAEALADDGFTLEFSAESLGP